MIKTLLIYDDFSELTKTESYLKKVGFDVVGITSELALLEQILGFNPDVIVVSGRNHRVSTIQVAQKLNTMKTFGGKVICLLPPGVRPNPSELIKMKMDALAETQIGPEALIQVICRLKGLAFEPFLDKLQRKRAEQETREPKDPFADSKRQERYRKILGTSRIDAKTSSHGRDNVKSRQDELSSGWNKDELDRQDELRREFTEAMFRKKK